MKIADVNLWGIHGGKTGDADTLDVCGAWYNLVGRVVESIAGAKVIRLQ